MLKKGQLNYHTLIKQRENKQRDNAEIENIPDPPPKVPYQGIVQEVLAHEIGEIG